MNKWTIVSFIVVGGTASLLFLRLVGLEVAMQLRVLEWRVKHREEQRRREQQAREAETEQVGVVIHRHANPTDAAA